MASRDFGAAQTIQDLREIQRECQRTSNALRSTAAIGRSAGLSAAGSSVGGLSGAGGHAVLQTAVTGPEIIGSARTSRVTTYAALTVPPASRVDTGGTAHGRSDAVVGSRAVFSALKRNAMPAAMAVESAIEGDIAGVGFAASQAVVRNKGALSKAARGVAVAGKAVVGGFIGGQTYESAFESAQRGHYGKAIGKTAGGFTAAIMTGGAIGAVAFAAEYTGKAIYDYFTGRAGKEYKKKIDDVENQIFETEKVLGVGALSGHNRWSADDAGRHERVHGIWRRSLAAKVQREAEQRNLEDEQVGKFIEATASDALLANREAMLGNIVSAYEIEQRMTSRGDVYLGKTGVQLALNAFQVGGSPGEKFYRWENAKKATAEYSRIHSPRAGPRSEVD